MKPYDASQPLIFIHVPKTAGKAVAQIVQGWFGTGFSGHYFDEATGRPPARAALFENHTPRRPVCIYGHFNRLRGFGIEHNYPDARQCIAILRDPFEVAISKYYYIRESGGNWKDQSRVPKSHLSEYLMKTSPGMLDHFPRQVTHENYKDLIEEFFVDIGLTEDLVNSLSRIASRLGFSFDPGQLTYRNVTERDRQNDEVQDLRDRFRDRNRLEFEVYDYVKTHLPRVN